MGFFDRFFGSAESISSDLELNDEKVINEWRQYVRSIAEKKNLADNLPIDTIRFREIIKNDLAEIHNEEEFEEQIIKDLKAIKHESRVKRVHRLEHTLDYAETKYIYTYKLFENIYSILKIEFHLISLIDKSISGRKLILNLRNQINLELLIIEKIKKIDSRQSPNTFSRLFLELVRGERIIGELDSREKILLKRMQKIFSNEIPEAITYKWVDAVNESIIDEIHEAVANGLILGYHPDIQFEFVNRSMFIDLVRKTIQSLKTRGKISERMIKIFVEIYRQGFNEIGLD